MSRQTSSSQELRLFVALDPPAEHAAQIARWAAEQERAEPALRALPAGSMHLTLAFLGSRPAAELGSIEAIVAAIEPRPVSIKLDLAPVPVPGGRPRLYAVGALSPAAAEIAVELGRELGQAGFYSPPERPFWPHLTALRVRRKAGGRRNKPARIKRPPADLPDALKRAFGAVRLALYRSDLSSEGAQHQSLVEVELPALGGQER